MSEENQQPEGRPEESGNATGWPGVLAGTARNGCRNDEHERGEAMNYLRRLQSERPLLFWAGLFLAFWLGFQLVLFVVGLVLGPFGLPTWLPIVVVLGVLVLIARRQQGPR